ncbi:MAG: flippase activity-associated protein Agl23 [Phycisphaeraceae bacterium]
MNFAKPLLLIFAAVAIVLIAGTFRTSELSDRPLHGDEAVNMFKFKTLYDDGTYIYDTADYHGPTLPYLTLIAAAVHEANDFESFPPSMYRAVAVAAGLALVALTFLLAPGIGYGAAAFAALLVAVSPAMVFYSRYYIHEMPLVVFTVLAILAGWRYAVTGKLTWALGLGVALALMHATKETAIITWFAAGVATLALLADHHRHHLNLDTARNLVTHHMLAAVVAGVAWVVIAVVLFSAFFTHARGPLDSVLAFLAYFDRGTGGEPLHVQPWHYYFTLLGWHRPVQPLIWTEALTLSLASVGLIAAAAGRGIAPRHLSMVRWLAVFTVTMIAVYAFIPYKTPWNVLSFLYGLMLLAGVGLMVLAWSIPRWIGTKLTAHRPAFVAVPLAVIVLVPVGWATWQLSTQTQTTISARFNSDRRNPYVYAHPSRRVVELGDRLNELASIHELGTETPVQLYDQGNYWPFPWYVRQLENVGYFDHLPTEDLRGPIVLIEAHMDDDAKLWEALGETHAGPFYAGIRPDHTLALYVRKDLWETYIDRRR